MHEIFHAVLVSVFPAKFRVYTYSISENRLPLGQCTLYKNKIIIIIICFKNSSAGDSNQGILYFKSCKISLYDLQDSKPNPYRGSFSAEPLIVPELSGRMKRRDKG